MGIDCQNQHCTEQQLAGNGRMITHRAQEGTYAKEYACKEGMYARLLHELKGRIMEAAGKIPRGWLTGARDTHAQGCPAISCTLSLTPPVPAFPVHSMILHGLTNSTSATNTQNPTSPLQYLHPAQVWPWTAPLQP